MDGTGGQTLIHAEQAKGSLHLQLNGEAGGIGRDALGKIGEVIMGCQPNAGHRGGNAGSALLNIAEDRDFMVAWTNSGGGAGDHGMVLVLPAATKVPEGTLVPPCHKEAAQAGAAGQKGQVCMKNGSEESLRCQE